jgi:hypothetical protein
VRAIVSNYERRARQATSRLRVLHSGPGIKSTITYYILPWSRWEVGDYERIALSPDGHLGTGSPGRSTGVPLSAYESYEVRVATIFWHRDWQPAYKARLLRHRKSGSPLLKNPQTGHAGCQSAVK